MNRNLRTAMLGVVLVFAMGGLAFASVPLYRMFCHVTGFAWTTQRAEGEDAPGAIIGKIISVRFDANVAPAMGWDFEPERHTERVAVGAREMAFYKAKNLTNESVTGSATFNVTPSQAGQYFTKIQCFCFTEQTLKPGEEVRMPVVFFVDPKILDDPDANDISEITLSYTFYPVDQAKSRS
jgi:cytochrome c oxidase assembly protein subunit 11